MLSLENLLPIWHSKQPERCWQGNDWVWLIRLDGVERPAMLMPKSITWIDYAAVLKGARDALKAEGWNVMLTENFQDQTAIATITGDTDKTPLEFAVSMEPAIAMLAALLKALGAEVPDVQS